MKKAVILFTVFVFCVFGAFGGAKQQAGGSKDTVAFANLYYGNFFFFVEVESVKRGAEALGYKFVTTNANVDSAVQASQYQTYIDQGVKAIVADAVDSDALVDFVNRAHNAGIYTAMVDTCVSAGQVDVSVAFDNYKGGYMAGEKIIKLLTDKYGTPRGKVINVHGRMEGLASRLRSEGFEDAFKNYSNITIVRSLSMADGDAHDAVANQMAVHKDVDAIFVYSDGHLYGTIEALKKYDRWTKIGDPKHMLVVSLDGAYDTLQYIRDGWTDGVVAQDSSSYGLIAMELLGKYSFKGQAVPLGPYSNPKYYWEKCEIVKSPSGPLVSVPPYIIDKSNVDDPRHWANVGVKEWGLKPNM